MSDPRAGLRPDQPSGNDAYDKMTGKGIYYVHSPTPSAPPPPPPPPPAPPLLHPHLGKNKHHR